MTGPVKEPRCYLLPDPGCDERWVMQPADLKNFVRRELAGAEGKRVPAAAVASADSLRDALQKQDAERLVVLEARSLPPSRILLSRGGFSLAMIMP